MANVRLARFGLPSWVQVKRPNDLVSKPLHSARDPPNVSARENEAANTSTDVRVGTNERRAPVSTSNPQTSVPGIARAARRASLSEEPIKLGLDDRVHASATRPNDVCSVGLTPHRLNPLVGLVIS